MTETEKPQTITKEGLLESALKTRMIALNVMKAALIVGVLLAVTTLYLFLENNRSYGFTIFPTFLLLTIVMPASYRTAKDYDCTISKLSREITKKS